MGEGSGRPQGAPLREGRGFEGAWWLLGVGRPEGACAPDGAPLSRSLPGGERFEVACALGGALSQSLPEGERLKLLSQER